MAAPSAVEIDDAFGRVLARLRRQRGLSQEGLGHAAESGRTFISELERDRRGPSLKTVFRLSDQLGISPSKLVRMVEAELNSRS